MCQLFIIDGYFLVEKRPVGLHRFSLEILKQLDKHYNCNAIVVAVPSLDEVKEDFKKIKIVEVGNRVYKRWGLKTWTKYVYPLYVIKQKGVSVDFAFAQQTLKCDICGIFDCITIKYPEDFMGLRSSIARLINVNRIKRSAKKAKRIITLSENACNDIVKYTGISKSKISIVGCAWQHIEKITCDDLIMNQLPYGFESGNYFFSLGSQYPHKNIRWIIAAAEQNPNERFIISGTSFTKKVDKSHFPQNVYYTGYLTDSEIKSLMMHAKAFIQPSLYEGFGIPPMEALALGSEIIISNSSCLPEIYKGTAHYINPNSYENINLSEILKTHVDSPDLVLEEYSWEKATKQFYDILEAY